MELGDKKVWNTGMIRNKRESTFSNPIIVKGDTSKSKRKVKLMFIIAMKEVNLPTAWHGYFSSAGSNPPQYLTLFLDLSGWLLTQ